MTAAPSPTAAEVVLNLPVDLCLTYRVPDRLVSLISVGKKVTVPLGSRRVSGFVTAYPAADPGRSSRPLLNVGAGPAFFDAELVRLIRWVARYYFCSFPRALKTAIPAPVRKEKKGRRVQKVLLAVPAREADAFIDKNSRKAPGQTSLVAVLKKREAPVTAARLLKEADAGRSSLTALKKKGIVKILTGPAERGGPVEEVLPTRPLRLNREQEEALEMIKEKIESGKFGVFLFHGITGSGKTEVYLRAIAEVIKRGRRAIVLVPEISLTPPDRGEDRGPVRGKSGGHPQRPIGRGALRRLDENCLRGSKDRSRTPFGCFRSGEKSGDDRDRRGA